MTIAANAGHPDTVRLHTVVLACLPLLAWLLWPTRLTGQATPSQPARVLRGVVRSPDARPIDGANVFVLETLEGIVTMADGRFRIMIAGNAAVTLIVRRLGFRDQRRAVVAADTNELTIVLDVSSVSLAPVSIQAGQYTASSERGATLTPLDVVTTPGTAADVHRAIQSLPGVQTGDEGTAMFVRGGDFTETRVFLNDAALLTPVQLQTPTGTFTGSVDPFLLDGIFFSSGGFGARYGDALSGVVALRTLGRPSRSSVTATAGLAALSGAGAVTLSPTMSLRASANRTDLDPMFRLNRTRRYDPAPHGHDLSVSAVANYRTNGELKLFAIDQTNALGLGVEEASFEGNFAMQSRSTQGVATWRDVVGDVTPMLSLAMSRNDNATDFGVFRLSTRWDHAQLFGQTEWQVSRDVLLRGGGEVARLVSRFDGSIPESGHDIRPGARNTVIASARTGTRSGAFAEADWRPLESARLIAGGRTDYSTLTGRRTVDPRLSAAWTMRSGWTVTAAWGLYHQVPDPLYFDDSVATAVPLEPMRAEQRLAGVQLGDDDQLLRVEVYDKRYTNLAQRTRDYEVVAEGEGNASGLDVFVKGRAALGVTGRVSYSFVSSNRTDPDARIMARAPFDVSHSVTAVAERLLPRGVRAAVAYRYATGRPFTPVTAARFDVAQQVYVPAYAAPMTDRLPTFQRLDISASYFRPVTTGIQSVLFVSLMNVLDRSNAQRYRYSADYTHRFPVPSLFQRSVFFGGTITWAKEHR